MEPGDHLHHHRYRIRQLLGRGGMGAVYLAEDLNLASRLVAIKENLNNDEEAQRQFRREAVLLAHLRHPNLPQVIDFFLERDGRQYLVMEYVPGANLQEVLRQQGALPVEEAMTCIDQIMQAVAYMHAQRDPETGSRRAVIHRDIKPANIKRTPEGRYLLVDFGIAKMHTSTVRATAVSARALTPGYAPIEQYGGGTDERSDVYALGATLYALLSGKTPPSSVDLAAGAPLPPLRSFNSKIPAATAKVVERAMKLNAGDRYPSVEAMYEATFNRPLPTTPRSTTSPVKRVTAASRNRALALGLSGAGLMAVAVIWLILGSGGGNEGAVNSSAVTANAGAAVIIAISPTATPQPATATTAAAAAAAGLAAIDVITVGEPSATATATTTPTAADTATSTPSDTPTATETATATDTLTAEPTTAPATPRIVIDLSALATPIDAPTKVPTRVPTSTPIPTPATPTPTATRTPTPTGPPGIGMPTPTQAAGTNQQGGPTSANVESPPDGAASQQSTLFKWTADKALEQGQAFEVLFWRTGEDAQKDGKPVHGASTATEVMLPIANLAPGGYKWAVWLVQVEPSYERLQQLSLVREFTVSSSGGGGPAPEPTVAKSK